MRIFMYVYVRLLNTRQWTSLRVLNTWYVYVRKKRIAGKQPLDYETNYVLSQVITRLDELKVTDAMLQPLQHG